MEFRASDQIPGLTTALGLQARYSSDGTGLIIDDFDQRFIHYGPITSPSDTAWEQNTYGISNFYLSTSNTDIYPSRSEIVFSRTVHDSLENPYNNEVYAGKVVRSELRLKAMNEDANTNIVRSYETAFYDSIKYKVDKIIAPRYTDEGDLLFVSSRSHYKITSDSTDEETYHNLNYKENWLVVQRSDHSLDSLFQIPSGTSVHPTSIEIQNAEAGIAISDQKTLTVFNYNGQKLLQVDAPGRFMLSRNGKAMSYKDGKQYYRFSDSKQIDLRKFTDKLTFSQPYEQQALLVEADSVVHILDTGSEQITNTITFSNLPPLSQEEGKQSVQNLYYPLLTSENHLRLIHAENYYFKDTDECS
jgi:hypothetical protein